MVAEIQTELEQEVAIQEMRNELKKQLESASSEEMRQQLNAQLELVESSLKMNRGSNAPAHVILPDKSPDA